MNKILDLIQKLGLLNLSPGSLFILGMHRSGTSCLTGILEDYGLYLESNDNNANPFNLKGNKENHTVYSINKELLKANGGDWKNPPDIKIVPPDIEANIKTFQRKMAMTRRLWGVKDPRMILCLSAWEQKDTKFLGTFRHPNDVVMSLLAREVDQKEITNEDKEHYAELWYIYNKKLVDYYNNSPFPIVNFNWEYQRYISFVKNFATSISLKNNNSNFFDENLRHQTNSFPITVPKHQELYSQLVEIAEVEEKKLKTIVQKLA